MQIAVSHIEGFDAFPLRAPIRQALAAMGYERPTEIQARAIPPLLAGRDVLAQAQTGTGKTAAFGIPLANGLRPEDRYPQALVLAPTRELALQIAEELGRITALLDVTVAVLYGGAKMGPQVAALESGAQIVVGTPGRILDHLRRGTLQLDRLSMVVLDEADRMLDMGFMPDVERILRRTPRARQTALFSATLPLVIRIIARRYMRDPVSIAVRPEQATVEEIEQLYYEVAEQDKPEGLLEVLEHQDPERAIVFCRTQAAVDRVARFLKRHGVLAAPIHGSLTQAVRERTLAQFRDGQLRVLVATNVAARGLDIPDVTHVINYDIPEDPESYVHRIGRTARMGRRGVAITFVAEWDLEAFEGIKKVAGEALQPRRLALYGAAPQHEVR